MKPINLRFTSPDVAAKVYPLATGKTKVGRAPDNQLILQDASVSAHHCDIEVHGPEVIVHDGGSANGTWLNGTRVTGQRPVRNNDLIRFGTVEARVEFPEWVDEKTSANELT